MRTLRLSLVWMVILALLGGAPAAVMAQEDHSRSGVWVTVVEEEDCWGEAPAEYIEHPSGDYQVRGLPLGCEVKYSDPRLNGTMTFELNEDCFADGGCINWGPIEVVGTEGSWSGWVAGTEDPDANTDLYIVMVGAGDYEGLTHVRHASGLFDEPLYHHGVIYQGPPPPEGIPGPLPEPAE